MDHAEEARRLFMAGYNCAQAVFCAFRDVTGLDKEESFHLVSYQLWRILSLRGLREKVCIGSDIKQFLNPVEK